MKFMICWCFIILRSIHLRLGEILVIFTDYQIVVRNAYYVRIVAYNEHQRLSLSEGLPYEYSLRSIPANPPSSRIDYYTYLVSIEQGSIVSFTVFLAYCAFVYHMYFMLIIVQTIVSDRNPMMSVLQNN